MKEKWSVGRPGCVVSDTPQRQNDDPTDVAYYGGYCVAESIATSEKAHILAAAPELLAACEAFVDWYNVDSTEQKRDDAFYAAQDAIAKARAA